MKGLRAPHLVRHVKMEIGFRKERRRREPREPHPAPFRLSFCQINMELWKKVKLGGEWGLNG